MSFPDPIPPTIPVPPGYTFPAAPGAAGVLTNDGAGALSWRPAAGGGTNLPAPPGPDYLLKTGPVTPFTPDWSLEVNGGGF